VTRRAPALKVGEWVEVRSKEEILATLDAEGRLDGLPFMPEMLAHCNQRLQVFKRAHKTCDTIGPSAGRRMVRATHLEGARCDGGHHGGCQANCLIFWKDDWLKRVGTETETSATTEAAGTPAAICSEEMVHAATQLQTSAEDAAPVFRCQATELQRATAPLPWWDFRQYVEDYVSGNVTLQRIALSAAHSLWHELTKIGMGVGPFLSRIYDRFQEQRGGIPFPWRRGTIPRGQPTPGGVLNLEPGECVRVKSYAAILATLDTTNKNRGMFFGPEEVPYCGRTLRVQQRVERIIEEKTGRMLHFKSPSVMLEEAYCRAWYCERRKFCPRAIFTLWREVWLERTGAPGPQSGATQPTPSS
jgi:hypothetical protein